MLPPDSTSLFLLLLCAALTAEWASAAPVLQHQPTLFLCNIDELQVRWRRQARPQSAYEPNARLAERGGQGYNSGANGGVQALQEAPLRDRLGSKHHGRD